MSQTMKLALLFQDRIGIVADIASHLTEHHLNIISMEVEKSGDTAAVFLEIEAEEQPVAEEEILGVLRHLADIRRIRRIQTLPQEYREKRFQVLIDGVSDGVVSVNEKGRILFVNTVAAGLMGQKAAHYTGLHTPSLGMAGVLIAECLEKKIPLQRRVLLHSRRGKVECFLQTQPVTGSDGRLLGAVSIIKEMKEIREIVAEAQMPVHTSFEDFVGGSVAIEQAVGLARKIAPLDTTVAIRGESGTGKELFARAIHFESGRSGAFVPVNCAAMPETLLESELFGYAPGAFTGARKGGKPGLFEMASGGTLFLDEIGELPFGPQAKILRVLQEGRVRRIGGSEEIRVDARIITATNRNLEEMVRQKRFREDLYYRIHVVPVRIPPLRERISDIPLLADFFLFSLNKRLGKSGQWLSAAAVTRLTSHTWPGNVRELKNVMQRAAILCDGKEIDTRHLLFSHEAALSVAGSGPATTLTMTGAGLKGQVADFERRVIKDCLAQTRSGREAARRLGVSHTTLQNKIRKLGITVAEK